MAANFDDELTIEHGCIKPAGPLELDKDETPLRLDVWVWQRGGACVAVQREFPPGSTRWTTSPDPDEDHKGARFQPGAATAMGVLVSEKDGKTNVVQWTEGVLLVGGKDVPDHHQT